MKNYWLVILLTSVFIFNTCLAKSETLDRLMRRLAYSDDKHTRDAAIDYVVANPETAKAILLLQNSQSFQNIAKHNAFVCLEVSSYKGLITPEEFFDIGFRLMANINLYHSLVYREDSLNWYSRGLANYGWHQKEGNIQVLIKLFDTLPKLLASMEGNGLIKNSGLKNSFLVKIEGAKDAIAKHQSKGVNQAINKIEAAINEGNAQKGKQLDKNACDVFLAFCGNLIWQINHTSF